MLYSSLMDLALDAELLATEVFEQVVRLLRRLTTAGALTFAAAATLNRVVTGGPCRLTDLAVAESLSQPGMTQLVSRLERDGLVRRTASPDDRRVVLVEATAAGRELLRTRRAERAAALRGLLDRLGPEDQDAIHSALPALSRLVALTD